MKKQKYVSGFRRMFCLMALIVCFAGLKAQTFDLEIYDGMTPNDNQRKAIRTLYLNGDMTMEKNGDVQTFKRDGVVMFTLNETVSMPRNVSCQYDFITKTFNATARSYFRGYSEIAVTFSVSINQQNFPDVRFRRDMEYYDKDKNGRFSKTEIDNVDYIRLELSGVNTFEGVEYFTNLVTLIVDHNNLTNLDVSKNTKLTKLYFDYNEVTYVDLSANTALKDLSCSNNKLYAINLSNNTKLTELSCSDNKNLTRLDLSKNTALKKLDCNYCIIEKLDVSNCTKLTDLNCSHNKIESLDVSKSTALTNLYCYSNNLTELDVSKNTALTNLYCYSNKLTELDVSKNTALINLSCRSNRLSKLDVSNFVALITLECFSNKLTELKVSGATALKELDCSYNELTSLNLTNCPALKELSCERNAILGEGMTTLVTTLPEREKGEEGKLIVCDYDGLEDGEMENKMSTIQVNTARYKGWKVRMYLDWDCIDYAGVLEGDANNDGVVNHKDVEDVRDYLLTGAIPKDSKTFILDANSDSRVNVTDIVYILYLIREIY